jgi:leader peptidase (prepilin peptidase)/N-methyltransferase
MKAMGTLRAEPVVTADRVVAAWADAHPVVRRAVIAACVTAAALSTAVAAPATVRWSIAVVGVLLAVAAMVDVHEHKLPNRLLAAAWLVTIGGALATANASIVVRMLAGTVLAGGLMLLVRLARGVGMGDVKMASVIGGTTGGVALIAAPVAVAVAAFVAAAYGVMARRKRLPLGPALWLGWAVALAACATGWLL